MKFFNIFSRKKKKSYQSMLVRTVRTHASPRAVHFKKKTKSISKVVFQNIHTHFWEKYKYVLMGVLSIFLFGGSIGMLFFSHFFDLKNIILERSDLMTNITPIQQNLSRYEGRNIFFISKNDMTEDIQKNFPEMKQIIISKLLPRTLKIKLVEYDIVARIKGINEQQELYLNEIGMVRSVSFKNSALPLIEYKTKYDVQDDALLSKISSYLALQDKNVIMNRQELQNILQTKALFEQKFQLPIKQLRYYPLEQELHLRTEKEISFWIDISWDVEEQLEKLQAALGDFNIYTLDIAYVDLRVTNKIIYCKKNDICQKYDEE